MAPSDSAQSDALPLPMPCQALVGHAASGSGAGRQAVHEPSARNARPLCDVVQGVPAVHDELLGRSERPGFERAADRARRPHRRPPGGAGAQSAVDHGIRRCGVTYAVSSGSVLGVAMGGQF